VDRRRSGECRSRQNSVLRGRRRPAARHRQLGRQASGLLLGERPVSGVPPSSVLPENDEAVINRPGRTYLPRAEETAAAAAAASGTEEVTERRPGNESGVDRDHFDIAVFGSRPLAFACRQRVPRAAVFERCRARRRRRGVDVGRTSSAD